MRSTSLLHRRTFLALAGAGVGLAAANRLSKLVSAAPTGAPTRIVVVYVPHGVPPEHFDPTGEGENYQFQVGANSILEPFAGVRDKVSILRGLEIKGSNNHIAVKNVFTDGIGGLVSTPSIDQHIARGLGSEGLLLSTVPGWFPGTISDDGSLFHDGTAWLAPEYNPLRAYDSVFSGVSTGTADPSEEFRKLALGMTEKELEKLQTQIKGVTREENKIAAHLEAVRQLKAGGGALSCSSSPTIPNIDAWRADSAALTDSGYFYKPELVSKISESLVDIATNSLICGARSVVGLQFLFANCNLSMAAIGEAPNYHDPISHSQGKEGRESFARVQRFFYGQIARMCDALAAADDPLAPGTSVLDNTAILVTSEIADGFRHASSRAPLGGVSGVTVPRDEQYLPALLIGGGGGMLKSGRLIDFDNRAHGDALATLAAVAGVPTTGFGLNVTGPIAEVMA